MSYTVVGTRFRALHRFETEVLYLNLLERPAFAPEFASMARFHAWLKEQVDAGRSLGEIARAVRIVFGA